MRAVDCQTATGADGSRSADSLQTTLHESRHAPATLYSDARVNDWIARHLNPPCLDVTPVSLRDLTQWQIDEPTGNIRHQSGRFFTVTGARARHQTLSGELEWDQPVIDQPEIGILGILAGIFDGIMHFCLQAKEEPGNINSVQLSPTVQATFSNYTKVHGGAPPPFVEFFLRPAPDRTLFAKLQTEDGGRFLFKSNRNMIVLVDDAAALELPDNFIWLTLRQIASLLGRDNLIHACTRSILTALLFARDNRTLNPGFDALAGTIQWLDDQKAANYISVRRVGLQSLQEWRLEQDGTFSHDERRFFRVIGISVSSTCREVSRWDQPILANIEQGVIGLLVKVVNGTRYLLMQAKPDLGNRSIVQIGPTVQFTPANYIGNRRIARPFLFDEFMGDSRFPVLFESTQSEEGARFFREQHLHRVLLLPKDADLPLPPEFRWLSESEVRFFLHLGESVNSCARSVLSCLL